jgi:glycerate kinase
MITGDVPGDGAAGGLGLGLRAFCSAVPESGAKLAIALTGLDGKISGADMVITGEGCSDDQTENGKLCSELALFCNAQNVPCYLLSGKIIGDPGKLFAGSFATVPAEMPFEEIKPRSAELLYQATVKFAEKMFAE